MTTVAAVSAFAVPEWKVTVKMQPQGFALVEFCRATPKAFVL